MVDQGDKKKRELIRQQPGIVQKQLGYRTEFYHPNLVRTYIPTLPYESLDRTGGKVLPWNLMKLFDSCELSNYWPMNAKGEKAEKAVLYMQSLEISIDRSFHNPDNPKHPLIIDNKNLYVRRTSRAMRGDLYHSKMDKPYATYLMIDVNMDPETLRPKPFPAWWREHFNFPRDGAKIEHNFGPKPKNVCLSKHRIYFSDTDENNHANYTTYVRFCYDSFCENMLNSKYGSNATSLFNGGLRKLNVTYKKECLLGDEVTVHSWQTEDTGDTFHFELLLNNEMCAQVTFSFHVPLQHHSNL